MTTTDARPTLHAQARKVIGKKVRFLRRQGLTPANLFGWRQESLSLQVNSKELHHALVQGGRYGLIDLRLDSESAPLTVLLRGLQRHPLTRDILHVDLYRISSERLLHTSVPIHLVGEAPAAEIRDVMVSHELHNLDIECLPANLPNAIEVDLSVLREAEQAILVGDLTLPEGVTTRTDPEVTVVRSSLSRLAAQLEEEDAASAAEGEAATKEGSD